MSDYIINFTDPANGSFVIKPYTTNGPATPASAVPLDTNAVAADTSIVLMGKGMWDYGERVQESMVHMLEHFAYDTAPAYPVQGQIWYKNTVSTGLFVYDGSAWQSIVVGSLPLSGNLDLGGNRIVNLADPVDPQDAMTLAYADANYVNVGGDIMTGTLQVPDLTVTTSASIAGILDMNTNVIEGVDTPTLGDHAVNKNYVDGRVISNLADVTFLVAPVDGEVLSYDSIGGYWTNAAAVVSLAGLTDVNIPAPNNNEVLTYDTGTSKWISAPAAVGSDDYVSSGAMVGSTLELTMALGGTVDITGVAPEIHTHMAVDVLYDVNPTIDASYIRAQYVPTPSTPIATYPQNVPTQEVLTTVGEALFTLKYPPQRIILQADGASTSYGILEYETYSNRLSVYLNGSKQYASTRGTAAWEFSSPSANEGTHTGLVASTTYDFNIRVDQDGAYTNVSFAPTAISIDLKIVAVSVGSKTFGVVGDYLDTFLNGRTFTVAGSTGNDGVYTVAGQSYSLITGETTITTVEAIADATVDGTITVGQITFASLTEQLQTAIDTAALAATVKFHDSAIKFIPDSQGHTSAIELADGTGANPLITALGSSFAVIDTVYYNFGSRVAIDAADNTLDTFTVDGNYSAAFPTGARFVVGLSTGNDRLYEVIAPGASYGAQTTIPVTAATVTTTETTGNGTGYIYFARTLDYTENGTPHDPNDPGDTIVFTAAPTALDLIEVIVTK